MKNNNEKFCFSNTYKTYDFTSNPIDITFFKDLTSKSYCEYWNDNTFSLFNSYNNILYLIYANEFKSIISFNCITNQIINEIKYAHKDYISYFDHYLDKRNKTDLLLSLSHDNNVKIWNIINFECLLDMKEINKIGWITAASFLNDNNQCYIMTSNNNCHYKYYNYNNDIEFIKIFDLKGNKKKEINNSNLKAFFIDSYYDKTLSKSFIITGNVGFCQSYDYYENKIYLKYCENYNSQDFHMSIIIDDSEELVKLIESGCDGYIRIWDFHSAKLLNKIYINSDCLYSICLWNKDYLFVGCKSYIKLIELKNNKIIKSLGGHEDRVLTVKKLIHPKYGACLVSQDNGNSIIKIWTI